MRAPSSVRSSLLVVVVLAGCGAHPAGTATRPPSAPADGGVRDGAGGGDALVTAPPPTAPPPAPLTADECAALVDRMLAIGLAERRSTAPKAPVPSAEQQQGIRAQMIEQMQASCGQLARSTWQCAMAATDRPAMAACETAAPRP